MAKHLRLFIMGKVQGVSYRFSTKRKAESLGVSGRVQNMPDGSVYAEIEGEDSAVDALLEWCKSGPPFARVESIEQQEGPLQNYQDFQIIR